MKNTALFALLLVAGFGINAEEVKQEETKKVVEVKEETKKAVEAPATAETTKEAAESSDNK